MKIKLWSIVIFLSLIAFNAIANPIIPDPKLTPGIVDPAGTIKNICTSGYTATVRNVPQSVKNQVFKEYGINSTTDKFEVDHLISLELGGSNDIKNLWPESYTTTPFNAHIKDALENKLHALICSGKISLSDAQSMISKDWIGAYHKFVSPTP